MLFVVGFLLSTRRGTFPDSYYYRPVDGWELFQWVDLTGRQHAQPWVLTLVYAVAGSDAARYLLQLITSILAWTFLATEVRLASRSRIVGAAMGWLVMVIALSPSVATWNSLILSEAISVTLGAALLASVLRLVRRTSIPSALLFFLIAALFAFARPNTLPIVAILALATAAWAFVDRDHRRLAVVLTVALVVVGGLSLWRVANSNEAFQEDEPFEYSEALFYVNFTYRVLPDPAIERWMLDTAGMPPCEVLNDVPPDDYQFKYGNELRDAVFQCEALREWAAEDGMQSYLEYAITHPMWTFREYLDDLPFVLTPITYTPTASVLPQSVDALLVGQVSPNLARLGARGALSTYGWRWYEPLFFWFGAAVVLAFIRRRSLEWKVVGVGAFAFTACAAYLTASWLVMPLELERHGVPANILIRVVPLIVIAGTFNRDLAEPRVLQATNRE